jgi:hypothetical protein
MSQPVAYVDAHPAPSPELSFEPGLRAWCERGQCRHVLYTPCVIATRPDPQPLTEESTLAFHHPRTAPLRERDSFECGLRLFMTCE